MPRSKKLVQKNIFFVVPGFKAEMFSLLLTKYAKRYSMRLNSPSHDFYLRAIWILFNKNLKLFYLWAWSEKQFRENVGDEVLLQRLIVSKRMCFVLKGVAFLFVKNFLDFWYSGYFLFLAGGNSENSKKTKRLNKDEIKKQLIESININNVAEMEDLNS